MKTLQKILATILLGAACSSCDLTLIPEDTVTPQTFFKTETDLRLWTNQFYTMLESPDNAAGLNADDMVDKSMGDVISGTRMASNEKGWTWTALRKINYYLANSHNCTDEAVRTKYDGVAYFFRAYFYYEKVLRYGDVPWYEQVIGSEEEELLKKPREDRGIIMDHVMNDLKNAIEMLPREKDVARVTRWSALALKSRIALYEGTWRKYRICPMPTSICNWPPTPHRPSSPKAATRSTRRERNPIGISFAATTPNRKRSFWPASTTSKD